MHFGRWFVQASPYGVPHSGAEGFRGRADRSANTVAGSPAMNNLVVALTM